MASAPLRRFFPRKLCGAVVLAVLAALYCYTQAIGLDGEVGAPADEARLDARPAETHCRRGEERLKAGDFHKAIEEFSTALERDREMTAALLGRAAAFDALGLPLLAEKDLDAAVRLQPFGDARRQRAEHALKVGRFEQASDDCSEVIRHKPDRPQDYLLLGRGLAGSGRLEEAIQSFKAARDLEPTLAAEAGIEIAAAQKKKQTRDAQQPIQFSPEVVESLCLFGLALNEEKQYEYAIGAFGEALSKDPRHRQSYLGRGVAHLESGNPDTAIEDFSAAIRLDRTGYEPYLKRARAYVAMEMGARAVEDATQVIRFQPDCAAAYLYRSQGYMQDGRFDRAVVDAERAVAMEPLRIEWRAILAKAYRGLGLEDLRNGRPHPAVEHLAAAARWAPSLADGLRSDRCAAYRLCGTEHLRVGSLDAAIADLGAAIALDPQDAEALCARGMAFFKQGDKWGDAWADLCRASDIDPRRAADVREFRDEAKRRMKHVVGDAIP